MKKVLFILATVICMFLCVNVHAEDNVMKISMGGTVKQAKEIGSGKGISFTLPELDEADYYIYAIELAVFEKQDGESQWHIYQDDNGEETKKQYIESPDSLNFNVDFGDLSAYREKAKYKIAYRYYVRSIHDMSKIIIAGENEKDGWRLIGEETPSEATSSGFTFYKNANPTMYIESFSYRYHAIDGLMTNDCNPSELGTTYFPADAFANGLAVQMTANDFDTEDVLTVSYVLKDALTGETVASGAMPYDMKIKTEHESDCFRLQLVVSDNFGGSTASEWMTFMIDREQAQVISKFYDGGYTLKGRNLFSDFYVTDDHNEAMTDGRVYAKIFRDGAYIETVELEKRPDGVFRLDKTGMADGVYTAEILMFDKAGNQSADTFLQTLDSTAPELKFVTHEENPDATYYSTWMNESKNIIVGANDRLAGIKRCYIYLQGKTDYSITYGAPSPEKTITRHVTEKETGKLRYSGYVYDDAKTIDKTNNTYNSGSTGNYRYFSKYVWLDKTDPTVTDSHDDDKWYEVPYTVTASFYDYPSVSGKADASGVKDKLYAITDTNEIPDVWNIYSDGVTFTEGGVYYLHFKSVDYAVNETITTKRIRVNTKLQMVGTVRPTEEYKHTIYYSTPGFYVVKNTAYNTKYHFEVREKDLDDTIKTSVKLISRDDAGVYAEVDSECVPNGENQRDVVFNISYLDNEGNQLPDGVYDMLITLTEVKGDGEGVQTYTNMQGCEVVIKRNAPPEPIISTDSGQVTITYPEEPLSGSLNSSVIKSHYKKQFKILKDGELSTNVYKTYTGAFDADNFTVTALDTDIAGNTSVATKRIYGNDDLGDSSTEDILTEGNTTTVEESRAANVYYIGIRREKESGINTDVFDFIK